MKDLGILLVLLLAATAQSCVVPTKTQLSESKIPSAVIDGLIVVYPHFPCLAEKLGENLGDPAIIMSSSKFADALYPWFEPDLAPSEAASLERLLEKPHVHEKVLTINVRFLIGITTVNETDGFPGFFCGAGYGAVGCLGVGWEKKKTSLDALVWDLRNNLDHGAMSVTASGTSLFLGLAIPLVFVAKTEEDACGIMADAIVDGIVGTGSQ